jgi:hypothetical protein
MYDLSYVVIPRLSAGVFKSVWIYSLASGPAVPILLLHWYELNDFVLLLFRVC